MINKTLLKQQYFKTDFNSNIVKNKFINEIVYFLTISMYTIR